MERVLKVAAACALFALPVCAPAADEVARPEFEVDGLGFLGNRRVENIAWSLRSEKRAETAFLDVSFIENTLFLIDARLEAQGHLHPHYSLELTPRGGTKPLLVEWDGEDLLEVDPSLEIQSARVHVDKGTFYQYRDLHFTGLRALPEEQARNYFYTDRFLFFSDSERVFSPAGLERSARNLQSVLQTMGYQNARIETRILEMDDQTGEVEVQVNVNEGLEHRVRHVTIRLDRYKAVPGVEGVEFDTVIGIGEAFSQNWQQDYGRSVLEHFYRAGYAQAEARFVVTRREELGGRILVDGELHVNPGPRVRVSWVRFKGRGKTAYSVLDRRVDTDPQGWLNPIQLDEDRYRLARLGVFEEVHATAHLEPSPPPDPGASTPPVINRNVTFDLVPGDTLNVDLLFGYGSYDKLRGGIEITRENLWGRAHSDQLLLVQSFVSTLVEYRYRMPEFFDINNDLSARLRWLRREEISFVRREYGGELRLTRELQDISGATVSVGYRLQRLEARGLESTDLVDQARVGSLFGTFTIDRLDNPLFPEKGWQVRTQAQAGATLLGGEVDFQSLLTEASYHRQLSSTTLLHLAASWGMVGSFEGDAGNVPVNERFFPGGESSIRGYTEGEASPVNAEGEHIGAETYLQPTVELEQFVARNLSGVVFADGLFISEDWSSYLGDDFMLSLGLGVRYRTVVGPLRLEWAYNVLKRDFDPDWSLHLSLGYPF